MNCPRGVGTGHRFEHMAKNAEWRDDHTCSFCGSLSPDEFFRRVEAGDEVSPTDKAYKAYVRGPAGGHGKVYFQHLSDDDKRRFVRLANDGTMCIGYPGRFYVLPFFMRRADGVDAMRAAVTGDDDDGT